MKKNLLAHYAKGTQSLLFLGYPKIKLLKIIRNVFQIFSLIRFLFHLSLTVLVHYRLLKVLSSRVDPR